jgi:hypothetical protein
VTRYTSRFGCPSTVLQANSLLRKSPQVLWAALLFALGLHATSSLLVRGFHGQQVAPKPLTTRFVKRQPRLTKPLELRKRPQPKYRRVQRRMVSVKARVATQTATTYAAPASMVHSLARPISGVLRVADLQDRAAHVRAFSQAIESPRESGQRVHMSLEMLDVEALDTGEYQAMVVQDPTDKRNVRGFFHVATVGARTILFKGNVDVQRFIALVPQVMNRFTDIRTDVRGHYDFDSPEFLKTPFIFITASEAFELTESEATNLGRYLLGGGFAYVEPAYEGVNVGDIALRRMLRDALGSQGRKEGREWTFQIMPQEHAAYHCYFDLDGPPRGHDRYKRYPGLKEHLEEIVIAGRTVCIYSNKDLEGAWCHDFPYNNVDNTVPHMFLVNLIVFALTQEGSITNQVMDTVQ